MRIQDLTEGFVDGFKKGYGKDFAKPEKKVAPTVTKNPEIKKILAAVINGQQLDRYQLNALQQYYKQL